MTESACSSCRPSGRCPSSACCWPTSAPTSSASTGCPATGGLGDALAASPLGRGRRSIALDLRKPGGAAVALKIAASCDALIEGFRPGVAERLGLGPDEVLAANPKLVYGRMTGWGQSGPLAPTAGHDITYLAITGLLHGIGPAAGPPVPPANYVADFGGGAMFLATGLLAALLHARPDRSRGRWWTPR